MRFKPRSVSARAKGRSAAPRRCGTATSGLWPSPDGGDGEALHPAGMKRVVIIGGGTGGTLVANRLRRRHPAEELEIVVIDRDDRHLYQPGLLFVPFGLEDPDGIVRSRRAQLREGVEFRQAEVDRVDAAASTVELGDGEGIAYDALVVASGAKLLYEETEGLRGPGWGESVFGFYTLEDARALREALAGFERGRLVVNLIDMPIKCPVAPLEFCFLVDWFLRERGVRDQVEITYVTPLDAAFTKPVAAEHLGGMLERARDRAGEPSSPPAASTAPSAS